MIFCYFLNVWELSCIAFNNKEKYSLKAKKKKEKHFSR